MLEPFYSSKVLSPFLVEQVSSLQNKSHPCRVSFILAEQALSLLSKLHPCRASFLKRGGQVWAFVLSGAHTKDGLYLLWACGHGPIKLARPYLIFYPLQTTSSIIVLMLQWKDKPGFCKGHVPFHASPSIIMMLNPLAVALRMAHQAASTSPRI